MFFLFADIDTNSMCPQPIGGVPRFINSGNTISMQAYKNVNRIALVKWFTVFDSAVMIKWAKNKPTEQNGPKKAKEQCEKQETDKHQDVSSNLLKSCARMRRFNASPAAIRNGSDHSAEHDVDRTMLPDKGDRGQSHHQHSHERPTPHWTVANDQPAPAPFGPIPWAQGMTLLGGSQRSKTAVGAGPPSVGNRRSGQRGGK